MDIRNRGLEKEFEFVTARSGGPGGQHVNKTNSKAELRFNVEKSDLLTTEEKKIIKEKLKNKITKDGILHISAQTERSQIRNKHICTEKFYELLENALKKNKKRKKTRPNLKSVLKRLESKKHNSEKKERRKKDFF
ncbi:MAG: aminoacyl-tRNA hydrolase [Chlorobi bacterium]|nr:aminoacyl-tRNA hydrolase [Chlorobiota bacterium]